jgi:hypothetical protein
MGCGDMPHLRKCFCKNGYKHRVPEMEFSTLFVIAFWAFWISLLILVVGGCHLIFINFIATLGSLSGEPTRVLNETKPPESHQHLLLTYDFQIEPVKIESPKVGCEYWDNYINTLDATEGEKSWLSRIAFCESTCNPNAISSAGATGLMQFMPRTWNWMGGGDINSPYEQIGKALMMYRKGMANHWCCHKLI